MDIAAPVDSSLFDILAASAADPREVTFPRYLAFRGTRPGEVVALEAIRPTSQRFRFAQTMLAVTTIAKGTVQLIKQADEEFMPQGCYIQQNLLYGHVSALQAPDEWRALRPGEGLKNEHIAARRSCYFDFDPDRPKGVSATTAERGHAFEVARGFVAFVVSVLGDDRAIGLGSSGNGIQVHLALADLANDEDTTALIRRGLEAAAVTFSTADVKVDTSVFDARRICPAFGTMKRKGADHQGSGIAVDDERPHRRTAFVCRDVVRRLSFEELAMVCAALEIRGSAGQPAPPPTTQPVPARAVSPWDRAKETDIEDVSAWLDLGVGDAMRCPGCDSTQGYGRVPGSNLVKCHHERCNQKGVPGHPGLRTSIDLVVEAKGIDAKEAVNLLAEQFGFTGLTGKKGKAKAPPPPPPASMGAPWETGLLKSDTGRILSNTANVELILSNDPAWSGVLGFNELRNAVVFLASAPGGFLARKPGDEWQDDDDVACSNWLQRGWSISVAEGNVRGVVSLVAHRSSFHPIRDELARLEWDGVGRVHTWLSTYLGVPDTPYTRRVGLWWLVSAVARAQRPGVKADAMLILEGPQGIRKSSALRALAGDDYFLDDLRVVGGVECAKQLRGKWMIELSELDAMRKAEASTVKRFLSSQVDNYRPSYGRSAADFPRQCIFAGTTNRTEYLQDETGGRRFWPVRCGTIDLEAIRRDRHQLWAEAKRLYDAGERWWPETPEDIALCDPEQESRQMEDAWTDKVAEFVAGKDIVSTEEVLRDCLGVEVPRMTTADQKRVGAILRGLQWYRAKVEVKGGGQRRVFRRGDGALQQVAVGPAGGAAASATVNQDRPNLTPEQEAQIQLLLDVCDTTVAKRAKGA